MTCKICGHVGVLKQTFKSTTVCSLILEMLITELTSLETSSYQLHTGLSITF